MITAIAIRDTLADLLVATFPELSGTVTKRKDDVVEVFPSASIFLDDVDSQPSATRGMREREIPVHVVIYNEKASLESHFAQQSLDFEKAVELQRKTISSELITIHLSRCSMQFTPETKATQGALQMTFTARTVRNLRP